MADDRGSPFDSGGEGMTRDRHGNPLSGADAKAAEAYDTAVAQVGIYRGDPLGVLDAALRDAPQMVMGHVAKAWLMAVATEPAATGEGRRVVAAARALPADERERSHLAALALVLDARWDESALALERHSARWPKDILALQVGHLADFFRGNSRALRDRIARALPHWSTDTPGGALVLGMYSFGLEEMGDYARAEDAGRRALDAEPLDCWAHHAVTHVMEMQGRAEDGVAWMAEREPWWSGDDNFFKIHNHWHRALFHLDLGQPQAALALYDEFVRKSRSTVAVDLVDASALLWRLHLLGHDVGGRWSELAEAWLPHADGRSYPFNDWHAAMACLGAGRDADVGRIESDMRAAAAEATPVAEWIRASGLPLVQGFRAFWRGDYREAAEQLLPARSIANRFGGSHAQRDVIDWTLTEAALRAGLDDLAEALAHERLALRPRSPVNLGFASRAQRTLTREGNA
jgi:tetratricopeptide (TPR) repeat protein